MPLFHLFQCPGCGLSVPYSAYCQWCKRNIQFNSELLPSPICGVEGIAPLFFSVGTTHRLFKAWKQNRGLLLEKLLFQIRAELASSLRLLKFNAIIPVPQQHGRNWTRGHASAESAASFFARTLKIPVIRALDAEDTFVDSQKRLNSIDRELSQNPFTLKKDFFVEDSILIVDDLVTTGSTLLKVAEILKESNPNLKLYAACLGYRPAHRGERTTLLDSEFPLDQCQSIQEQAFYNHFLNKTWTK